MEREEKNVENLSNNYITAEEGFMPISANYTYSYLDQLCMEEDANRHILINYDVNADIIQDACYRILKYNKDDMGIPCDERKPIIIYINTPGGIITDGFALIDVITLSKTPVITVNLGTAYSMGFLIFIAGEIRYAMPNSSFLIHDGEFAIIDSSHKNYDAVDFYKNQQGKRIRDFVISNTNITSNKYEKNKRNEWYFYPEEGKELGVLDKIVGLDCEIDEVI